MTERQLSDSVAELAVLFGWKGYHTYDSRRSQSGFPDWIFLRGPRCLAIELKVAGKKPAPQQVLWLEAFQRAGFEADVWDTDDWARGHVETRLR